MYRRNVVLVQNVWNGVETDTYNLNQTSAEVQKYLINENHPRKALIILCDDSRSLAYPQVDSQGIRHKPD